MALEATSPSEKGATAQKEGALSPDDKKKKATARPDEARRAKGEGGDICFYVQFASFSILDSTNSNRKMKFISLALTNRF